MALRLELPVEIVNDLIDSKLVQLERKQKQETNTLIKEIIGKDIAILVEARRTATIAK